MTDIEELGEVKTLDLPDEHVLSVDTEKRIIALRVVRYNEVVDHPAYGRMLFLPGAFDPIDPPTVRLRNEHASPTGIGLSLIEDPVGPVIPFKVSRTQAGDDQLTLARDGVSRGTSPGFMDIPGKPQQKLVDGKVTTVYGPSSARLAEVSTTWTPTFPGDGVVYMLHSQQKGSGPMAEPQEPAAVAAIDTAPIVAAITSGFEKGRSFEKMEEAADKMLGVVEQMKDLSRAQFSVPAAAPRAKPKLYDWADVAIKMLKGDTVSEKTLKELALDDVVVGTQPGLVPEVFTADFDDLITPAKPFADSLRHIAPPATGMTMTLPILTSRAVAGTQYGGEKTEVTTTAPKFGTVTFPYVDIMAGADVSIQFIQRGDRSALDLIVQELGEAYGFDEDTKALAALLNLTTDGPIDGGTLDPEDLQIGDAWQNSITAYRRAPDKMWMSSTAVRVFIDAKDPTSNGPLYSSLAASITAADGPGGTVSGLRPIYVPALDNTGIDVLIGPSRSYVVAEVPALRLQADVPAVAGRDLLLIGGAFFGPRYGSAFTTYTVAS